MRWIAALMMATTSVACSQPVHLDWKTELPGASLSTPLVAADFIAVGHEQGVSILSLAGKVRCAFSTYRDVISAPKTDGKLIFFGSTNYLFYAITPDCKEAWKLATSDRIKSDPLVADGRVYVTSYDGHLYALNAGTGERLWVFPSAVTAPKPAAAEPAADNKAALAKAKPKAKNKKNGKHAAGGEPPEPTAAANPTPPPEPPPPVTAGEFSYSSPILVEGVLYVGNLDHHLYAIDAATGALKWRFETEAPVTSSPLVRNKVAYFGSNDSNLYAVDVHTNKLLWKMGTRDWINSSPVIVDGVLYIGGNDRHVYAVDAVSGQPLWTFETKGPEISIPAVYKDWVIAAGGSGDGSIYMLNRGNGTLFWQFTTGGKIESDPVVSGERLFVSSSDGFLYAFAFRIPAKT